MRPGRGFFADLRGFAVWTAHAGSPRRRCFAGVAEARGKHPGQIIKRGANSTFVSTFFVTLYSLMLSAIKLINMGKAYVSPKRRNDLRSIGLWHGFRQTSITEGENSRSCMI